MKLFLIFLLLAGCGVDPSNSETEGKDVDANGEPIVDESIDESDPLYTMAVRAAKDLPQCNEKSESRLAYIRDTKKFKVCEEGEWTDIEVVAKGEKGDPGEDAESPEEIPDSVWVDPIDGSWWVFTLSGNFSSLSLGSCSGDWSAPSEQQIRDAAIHGIKAGLENHGHTPGTEAWVDQTYSVDNTYGLSVSLTTGSAGSWRSKTATTSAILCIKD